ncbi:MAG: endonuclease [Candidatus Woesearchaeota archaeon]|nr:endonuclease [Candidatus Woesearchaeota archaeon]
MLKKFGPQGWWPLSKGRMQTRHHSGPPKDDHDRWEIIVGAILTQNTAWTNVEKAIENLNRAKLLSIDKIRKVPVKNIAGLIRPAGYYNQKAERLKIVAEYFSKHFKKRTIPSREELLKVKGIGPETADSILLYTFEQPYFVVDAYTRRVFSRLGLINKDADYEEIQKFFMENLPKNKDTIKMYKEYHALIVELAKRNCRTKPICDLCLMKCSK